MSSSKARFQSQASSGMNSKTVPKASVNPSKRGGVTPAGIAASGFAGTNKTSVQVIHNGKIVTPQSLIPRKSHASHAPGEFRENKHKGTDKSFAANNQTIDEAASDNNDNKVIAKLPFKKPNELTASENKLGGSRLSMLSKKPQQADEMATIILSESPTLIHLAISSMIVPSDTRDVIVLDEKNARYEAVVKAHKNVDGFTTRPTQTKNNPIKNQNEMAAPNALRESGSQASAFDIKDSIAHVHSSTSEHESSSLGVGTDTADDLMAGLTPSVKKFVTDTVGVAMVTPGCLLDTTAIAKGPEGATGAGGKGKKGAPAAARGAANNKAAASTANASSGVDSESRDSENNNLNEVMAAAVPSRKISQTAKGMGAAAASATSGVSSGNDSGNDAVRESRVSNSDAGNSDAGHGGGGGGGGGPTFTEEDSLEILREHEIKKILSSSMLLKRLHMIERAVQQNANHRPQLDYRDLPDIVPLSLVSSERVKLVENNDQLFGGGGGLGQKGAPSIASSSNLNRTMGDKSRSGGLHSAPTRDNSVLFSDTGSNNGDAESHSPNRTFRSNNRDFEDEKVKKLFSYTNADLIQGRAVTAMVFNAVSSDLLAVGYGKTDVFVDTYKAGEAVDEEKQGGLVLFWSLRNPDYPEKILRTAHPVTALDFSKQRPMILAVGLLNGDVCIYDVKREGSNWTVPIESSAGMQGGHSDPVWQLKWIVKGVERLETLTSISTDGSVLEWNLKKGLVVSTLMQLKKSGTGEGWISNSAAGLSFDFHPLDPTTYITGTEEGSLYRCSVSYNEQYLETYQPHDGPIYRVKFSSRWPSVFLTCSADWSMGLYHLKSKTPLLSMRATGEDFPIADIAWCPGNSTVFACATIDAKVQIWDLSVSSIDPVVTIDTCAEEDRLRRQQEEAEAEEAARASSPGGLSPPTSPSPGTRYFDRTGDGSLRDEDSGLSAVNRLLKKLAVDGKKKTLTSLQFGDKTPTIVVGDSRGAVTVYRIFDPVTITHMGPLQQTMKLKSAIMRLTDPTNAAMLMTADNEEEESKN